MKKKIMGLVFVLSMLCICAPYVHADTMPSKELKWLCEPEFDYALSHCEHGEDIFNNFFALAEYVGADEDGYGIYKYGLVNTEGDIVVPAEYDRLIPLNDNLISVRKGDYCGVINTEGKIIIPIEYDSMYSERLYLITENLIKITKYETAGAMDLSGKEVIPLEYDEIIAFSENLIAVEKNGLWGAVDGGGNLIVPIKYDGVWNSMSFHENHTINFSKGDLYGLIGEGGVEILPFEYEDINVISDTLYSVKKNGKYGMVDNKNNIIIPFEYKWVGKVGKGLIDCWDGDSDHIYDFNGNFINNPSYDVSDDSPTLSPNLIIAKRNNLYGVINTNDDVIIPFEYDGIGAFTDELFSVRKDGHSGIIDTNGNILVPIEYQWSFHYDSDDFISEDFIRSSKYDDGIYKYGVISTSGNVVISCEYDDVIYYKDNLFIVNKDDMYGILDEKGNVVVPIKYNSIISGKNTLAVNDELGLWGFATIEENNKTMITAFYKDCVLVDIQTTHVSTGDESAEVPVTDKDADTAKVFIWNSLDNMKPLCEAKSVNLNKGV